ncbi:phosphatidate cytidylyltransferase [Candidatus Pelagibacter sp.]|nr:phosphatidate cytidylyltransferase [Candidatus Pelagibacter sp.]
MFNEFEKRLISSLILIPIVIFFIIQGSTFFTIFLSLIFLITSYEWLKMNKKNYIINLIGIIFLLISFYCAFYLRENNLVFFLLIVIVCIFTDVGGYIFGKTLKGPKLTKISPNKTYSGAIGSFLISLIAGLTYLDYLGDVNILNNNYLKIFLLIFFVSLTSQLGDLVISFFKRQARLKDTGMIIPGHGGMLDRIDGLIFALPISYILILIMDFI